MKVFLSLSIVLAIFGAFVTADFEEQIQDVRARFHGIHKEMDYYLRDSRWNVSTLLKDWNTNLLSQHAFLTADIINRRYEVYGEIADRASQIGNQNQCLIDLDSRLVAASISASAQGQECATASYNFVADTIRDNYFDLINLIQRESSSGQHVQFYGMGAYNVITNQPGVLNFLEGVWDEVSHGWPNIWSIWVDEEEAKLQLYRTVGTAYSTSCILQVFSAYSSIANGIRGEIAGCT